MSYITKEDIITLFRKLSKDEEERAEALIPIVEDSLRMEAMKVGKDLDLMMEKKELLPGVLKSVIVDVIGRALMTSTDSEPMIQTTQTALGYSFSGTFLNPGGGLFIKKSELARLGLRRQRYGVIDFYVDD